VCGNIERYREETAEAEKYIHIYAFPTFITYRKYAAPCVPDKKKKKKRKNPE